MKNNNLIFTLLFSILSIIVISVPAFAVQDDGILSQHVMEADGTTGQDTNIGSGVKTGHIQDGAITTPKIADGAVTDSKITGPISGSKISSAGLDADTVDGQHASAFADANHNHDSVYQKHYNNEIVVSTDGNGNFTTITAALNSIPVCGTDPVNCPSATNPYCITVKPGIYVEDGVVMKSYVDIVGSGQENTIVQKSPGISNVITTADNSTLENIQVSMAGSGSNDNGVYVPVSGTLRNVTVSIPAGVQEIYAGIEVANYGELKLTSSKVFTEEPVSWMQYGVQLWSYTTAEISDSVIDMSCSGSVWSNAFQADNASGVVIRDSVIKMACTGTKGATAVWGDNLKIYNTVMTSESVNDGGEASGVTGKNLEIHNCVITATCLNPTTANHAIDPWGAASLIRNSTISSSQYGVRLTSSSDMNVSNSTISGDVKGIYKFNGGTFRAGNCQIAGGHDGVTGVDKIVNCYDGSYNPIPNM